VHLTLARSPAAASASSAAAHVTTA